MNLKAIFPTGITELTVNGLHQWDYGRKLEIHATDLPALVEVHFACPGMDEAIVRVGSAVGGVVTVAIPDRCLEQYAPITAWVYEVGETYGQTIKSLTLNIMKRARPQVAEPLTPEICDKYTEAVGAMNGAVGDLKSGKVTVGNARQAIEAERATNSGYASKAGSLSVYIVRDLDQIQDLIFDNPDSLMGISIRTEQSGIEIPTTTGKVLIPNWAYGTLTIDEIGDASIHLTAYTGEVFHLFYNANGGDWVKGSISATEAGILRSTAQNASMGDACLLDIYTPGIYVVNISSDYYPQARTAVFCITDLTQKVIPSGDYPGFTTVEYQPQGINETGEQYGYIVINSEDHIDTVTANIVFIANLVN